VESEMVEETVVVVLPIAVVVVESVILWEKVVVSL